MRSILQREAREFSNWFPREKNEMPSDSPKILIK
jgi:hypothetical protein